MQILELDGNGLDRGCNRHPRDARRIPGGVVPEDQILPWNDRAQEVRLAEDEIDIAGVRQLVDRLDDPYPLGEPVCPHEYLHGFLRQGILLQQEYFRSHPRGCESQ